VCILPHAAGEWLRSLPEIRTRSDVPTPGSGAALRGIGMILLFSEEFKSVFSVLRLMNPASVLKVDAPSPSPFRCGVAGHRQHWWSPRGFLRGPDSNSERRSDVSSPLPASALVAVCVSLFRVISFLREKGTPGSGPCTRVRLGAFQNRGTRAIKNPLGSCAPLLL